MKKVEMTEDVYILNIGNMKTVKKRNMLLRWLFCFPHGRPLGFVQCLV